MKSRDAFEGGKVDGQQGIYVIDFCIMFFRQLNNCWTWSCRCTYRQTYIHTTPFWLGCEDSWVSCPWSRRPLKTQKLLYGDGCLPDSNDMHHTVYRTKTLHSVLTDCSTLFPYQRHVAQKTWPWNRWPWRWATSHGLTPEGQRRSSPLWHRRGAMPAVTPRTTTVSWDASPVAPTTPWAWRPTAARATSLSAPIRASHPVSCNFCHWKSSVFTVFHTTIVQRSTV